jgi:hypothetical protein
MIPISKPLLHSSLPSLAENSYVDPIPVHHVGTRNHGRFPKEAHALGGNRQTGEPTITP